MKVENIGQNEVERVKPKNQNVKIKEKNGVVTKTTVTKEDGVTTTTIETTYPDGRRTTQIRTSGCGVHNLGSISLGPIKFIDKTITDESVFNVVDENGEPLIGESLKNVLKTKGEITMSDVLDKDGKVKADYRILDLNSDGRLADNEFSWFANGGTISREEKLPEYIAAGDFEISVKSLDKANGAKPDGVITNAERAELHNMLNAPEKF